jgi:hypothetical protein
VHRVGEPAKQNLFCLIDFILFHLLHTMNSTQGMAPAGQENKGKAKIPADQANLGSLQLFPTIRSKNESISGLFHRGDYEGAAQVLRSECARIRLELGLRNIGETASRSQLPSDFFLEWLLIRPVLIRDLSTAASKPDLPPNAYELYPYVLKLDCPAAHHCGKERIYRNARPSQSTTRNTIPAKLTAAVPKDSMPAGLSCSSGLNWLDCIDFLPVVSSTTDMYNLAMAHIGLSRQKTGTTIHLRAAARVLRWVIRLLKSLEVELFRSPSGDDGYRLYGLAVMNQIRLATFNNLAYIYSVWGRQTCVNECLEFLHIELVLRSHLSDAAVSWYRRVRAAHEIETRPSDDVLKKQLQVPSTAEYSLKKGIEAEQAEAETLSEDSEQLRVLLAQLENENGVDGMLTLHCNYLYLNPAGCTPISGTPVA